MKKTFSVNTIRLLAGGILALSCLSATAQQQPAAQQPQQAQLPRQPEAFTWQTHILTTGDTFKAVYRPPVPLNTPVKGYIYYFKNFAWHGYDFPLVKTDTGWLVRGIVPEGAAAMAFRFYLGDTLDRGGRWPYMILIHDKNKQMMPGAYTEYAVIRRQNAQGMMSELVTKQSLIEAKVAVQLYISREWGNMQVRRNMFYPMAMAIKDYFSPGKTDSVLRSGIAEITALPDVTEKELITVQRVFDRILHNRTSADSMGELIMAKYPGGLFARERQLYDVFRKMMETKQIQPWYDFLKTYPQDKYPFNDYLDPVTGDIAYFFKCFTYEAGYYFNNHNWEGLRKMSSYTPVSLLPYMYMHYVMYPFRYSVETIPAAEAFTLSKVYMADIISHINSKDSIVSDRGLFAASEWPGTYMRKEFSVFTYHAKLLYDNGEYAAAMQFSRMLQPNIGFIDVSFNDVYVKLLVREKKNNEALEYIKKAVHANAFTGDMIKVLKADYLKNKGDEKTFPAYVISLKSKESVEKEQEAIRRAMVSVPAPGFDLADSKGEKVSLAAQKGKIVVLDFWATWCYPCKMAMPGMQMAVERFKQEKDVAFYFISTLEKHPRYKQMADSFVTAKKFDFRVIFDNKTDSSELPDQTYEAFRKVLHFNGIPEKVIIDQNGVIRWWSSGGSDNHIALAEEIAYVIELLKKEQEAKVVTN